MKIIFFGTPDFAVPSLKILNESEYEVAAVVTAPDKERGRGRKISATPVKQYAVDNNIPVLQPEKLKDEEFVAQLKKIEADLFVVVAFRILPREVYTMPSKGSFNLHGSILPKYRGAAPIQWAIINGEKETGVTTFFLKDKVDTGNIIDAVKITISDEDNLGSVHDKMSLAGADLVLKTVKSIDAGNVKEKEQDDSLACPAPKINKDTCLLNWNNPAQKLNNLVRGLSPYPGAFFIYNKKSYKVFKARVSDSEKLSIGEIKQNKNQIFIGCAEASLELLEIQPEGRKRMTTDAFLRGHSL
ncbi:MAG: methionyl-tRNA formyltransferase [Melioribacteraceae bacterium]|nr:methionyl-tRNA formyltransferase [Melioribacteraceae bacterium]